MKYRIGLLFAVVIVAGNAFGTTFDVIVGPGFSFNPSSVTIAPGDIVRWVWQGAAHSSTSNTNTGPEVWDSGILVTGTFSHTFTTVGDWPYYCSLHSFPGGTVMNGVVHVVAPAPAPTPTLSITALLLLVAVLAVIGFVVLRR